MNIADRSPRHSGFPRAETAGPLGRPENASLRPRRPDDVRTALTPETAGEARKRALLGHFGGEPAAPNALGRLFGRYA